MSAEQTQLEQYRDELSGAVRRVGEQAALDFAGAWADEAWAALVRLARSGAEFGADELTLEIGPAPSPSAIGAIFRSGAQTQLIEAVGVRQSTRLSRHGGLQRLWRGRGATR